MERSLAVSRESSDMVPEPENAGSDSTGIQESMASAGQTSEPKADTGCKDAHEGDENAQATDNGEKTKPNKDDELPPLQSRAEIKAVIEALLFATTEPLSIQRLTRILAGVDVAEVRQVVFELQQEYEAEPRGLSIVEVAGGFQMATRPHLAPWIYCLKPSRRRQPLSQATLETLAIVAYKQPITRAEIEAIRGVDSSATLHTLLELGLIDVGGRREVPGRPQLYVTTQQFLKAFGLKSLGDLPSIHELRRQFAHETPGAKTTVASTPPRQSHETRESNTGSLFPAAAQTGQPEDNSQAEGNAEPHEEPQLDKTSETNTARAMGLESSSTSDEEKGSTASEENPM